MSTAGAQVSIRIIFALFDGISKSQFRGHSPNRYSYNDIPLPMSGSLEVPHMQCSYCSAPLVFEMQVLPGLISFLKSSHSGQNLFCLMKLFHVGIPEKD